MNMCEKQQNLCKSVIERMRPKSEWHDEVFLAESCKERFLTTDEIPELLAKNIFMGGLAELRETYYVERQSVSVHTLLFTQEGGGILTTSEKVELIEPYSLVILPSETSFRFELNPAIGHWKMAWVLPYDTEEWQFLREFGQCIVSFNETEQVWSLLNLMHAEINGRTSFRKLLVSEIIRLLSGFEPKSTGSSARVQALFNEVESQLHLPWSVSGMAEKVYISEEQLNRICKSLFGLSPRRKLIHLRMDKAVSLLNQQEWSISMISQRLGYKDPYNFSHRFRKHFGQSPSQYRKTKRSSKLS